MPIVTKRISEPPSPDDGLRLLVMRLWPRGIKKTLVSEWVKELGPSPELLRSFLDGKVIWPDYVRRYHAEMANKPDLLQEWANRALEEKITLLCACKYANYCHRTLLKALLEARMKDGGAA